jgi:ferric-dicitrate binding protein FerR (iron transport regulator)
MKDAQLEALIQGWLQGTLDDAQHAALERRLLADAEARWLFRAAANLDSGVRDWAARDSALAAWAANAVIPPRRRGWSIALAMGLAASVALAVAWWPFRLATPARAESTARGCAILTQAIDATWTTRADGRQPGDTLSRGTIALTKGVVQIEFFSGAALMLEGPAELEIVSSWEAVCRQGKARVRVPPSARGFTLRTPDLTLVDLGTEFGAEVNPTTRNSRVQVFDGEVKATRANDAPLSLKRGEGIEVHDGAMKRAVSLRAEDFVNGGRMQNLTRARARTRYAVWEEFSRNQRADTRLIAYFPMMRASGWERLVGNAALPENPSRDGGAVGATWAEGRWPQKDALEFKRPGDRVRLQIDGRYEAITMACWIRVDGLDRRMNGIFLTDGYEIGTPHWQIHDNGRVVFTLSYGDTADSNKGKYAFKTPPFFDVANLGRWHHLAVTCDTQTGIVAQYIDGREISRERHPAHRPGQPIVLGGCELGNWGLPLPDAAFPVRNLNGRIDEFALYAAVLTPEDIRMMYEAGRPE